MNTGQKYDSNRHSCKGCQEKMFITFRQHFPGVLPNNLILSQMQRITFSLIALIGVRVRMCVHICKYVCVRLFQRLTAGPHENVSG